MARCLSLSLRPTPRARAQCSANATSVQTGSVSSDSGGFSISSFFGYGESSSSAQSRLDAYKSAFCTSGDGSSGAAALSKSELDAFSAWVDPNLVSAFLNCRKISSRGLSLDFLVTPDNKAIPITLGGAGRGG